MTPGIANPFSLAPATIKALYTLKATFKDGGLEFEAAGTGADPRLADQRLRLMPAYDQGAPILVPAE